MAKDLSTYRVPHELRVAAAAKARETGVPVTDVLLWALGEFAQGRLPADLVREMSRRPPEPADPPAAPVAPPQGQSAPMERSEAPRPRTDPEPAPERKRKAPAKRAAAAPEPIADEAPAPLAAAHALAEKIGAPLKAASDLRPAAPLPEVTPGTVMFAEPGATPVVTYEVPPVPRTCPHQINRGVFCKMCQVVKS